jgi:hypothetical protein
MLKRRLKCDNQAIIPGPTCTSLSAASLFFCNAVFLSTRQRSNEVSKRTITPMDDSSLRVNFIQAIVANEERRNRTEQVSGLRLGREHDVALFPLEDLHRDPLLQDSIQLGAQQLLGNNLEPHLPRNEGLMELDNEQREVNAQGEVQAHNEAMEADDETDEEMRNFQGDPEAEWSDNYPIVSSPGSSHSSSRFTPVFEPKIEPKCYAKLEADELERIEKSICRAEEKELIRTLDDLLCRAEEKHLLKILESRIVKVEMEIEKLHSEETVDTMIRAQLKVPRLLPGSTKEFITSDFLTECTTNFEQECAAIKKETKLKTTLTDVKGSPQTWLLCAEGPKEIVRLFFVHWGKQLRRRVTSHSIQQLRLKGIELVLKLNATQSLGVRVESCDNQFGLLVLNKECGFKGQLANIISPENLAAGAIILQADGSSCKSVEDLKKRIEDVRKRGAKDIQIKFCLARSVDFNRIDHTAVASLPVDRSNGKNLPLPQVASHLRLKSVMDQQRTTREESNDEEWIPKNVAATLRPDIMSDVDTLSNIPDSRSKKRKENDFVTEVLQQKRVRNDQSDSSYGRTSRSVGETSKKKFQPVDGGGKRNINDTSSSHLGSRGRSDHPSAKAIGGDEQRTTKPVNKNDGLNEGMKVVNKSRNTEPEKSNILTSNKDYGVRYEPLNLPRPASNVKWSSQMLPANGKSEQKTTKPVTKNGGLSICASPGEVVDTYSESVPKRPFSRNRGPEKSSTLTSQGDFGGGNELEGLLRPTSRWSAQMPPVNGASEQSTTKSVSNNGGANECVPSGEAVNLYNEPIPKRPLSRNSEQAMTISRAERVAGKGPNGSAGFAQMPSLNEGGTRNAREASTQSRNGPQSKRQICGSGEMTTKSMDTNGGLSGIISTVEVGNANNDVLLKQSPSRNTEPGKASTTRSRGEQVAGNEIAEQSGSDNSTNRIGWQVFNQARPISRGVNSSLELKQAAAQAATVDTRSVGNSSRSDGNSMTQSPRVSERRRNETSPPKESVIIDTHAIIHIDTDHQEVFKTKLDPELPLGFYCIYDSFSKSCRVVSVCKTGQASRDERIQPGTKLIGILVEKTQTDSTSEVNLAENGNTNQNDLVLDTRSSPSKNDDGPPSYKDEVDEGSGVCHIWGPQDLMRHMTAARTKRLPTEVWFANDSDNPYFNSFKSRFREAQWGHEGEWRGPNFAGWDGVLAPKAFKAKKKSAIVSAPSRRVKFSGKDSTHVFFRTENMTSEYNGEDHWTNAVGTGSTANLSLHFRTLEDAISRGTVYDLIGYIFPFRRSEMREGLTQRHFTDARSLTRANTPSDGEMKDKLLKICARTLRAINLVRAFPFWERFDIHVVSIRSLQLPHSIKHGNCYIYLEAEQVSMSDTAPLPSSQSFLWDPTAIEIPDLFYCISFNKFIETNRTTKIRVMARPTNAETAILLGTVDITEADLSAFKANGEFTDYSRTLSTIIGEPFYLDFRVVRTSTPDERRKEVQAITYIRDGLNSIQAFNKDLGESREVKLSVDMHSSNEGHFTLLHAAIAMYDGPTLQKALEAGSNPFYRTPYCSPFDMAQQMSQQFADANGEIDQQRKSVIEQMILLMDERNRGEDANHADAEEVEQMCDPLYSDLPPIDEQMRAEKESMTEHITPILSHPNWLERRVRQAKLCRHFEKSQNCPRPDRCHFIHKHRSFSGDLNLTLEKSRNHIVPDHDTHCCLFLEEKSSTGQVWFTSGYLNNSNKREKQIIYAEGGQNGVLSSQNVWWYPTKAEAMVALQRVMAAHDWVAQQKNVPAQHQRKKFVEVDHVADSWTNLSKRRNGRCKYWPRCKDIDQKCRYFHGYGPFHQPSENHGSNAEPYDVRFHTSKDLREGRLYYTARYRLSSDNALRYVPNYNGEGFFDQKNELFWFESEEKVREAIASSK